MKNRTSIIIIIYAMVPVLCMIAFSGIYRSHQVQSAEKQQQTQEAARLEEEHRLAEQQLLEQKLAEQSAEITKAKEDALRQREAKILQEKQEKVNQTRHHLEETQADIHNLQQSLDEAKNNLENERNLRRQIETDLLATASTVERLQAERASTELETQRLTEMTATIVDRELAHGINLIEQAATLKK